MRWTQLLMLLTKNFAYDVCGTSSQIARMASYLTLKPYQYGKPLAVGCAKAAAKFPDYEQRALADQLRRAAYSVLLNIVEGASGGSMKQQKMQMEIARKSAHEVRVILEVSEDLGYLESDEAKQLKGLCDDTARTLYGYIAMLKSKIDAVTKLQKGGITTATVVAFISLLILLACS